MFHQSVSTRRGGDGGARATRRVRRAQSTVVRRDDPRRRVSRRTLRERVDTSENEMTDASHIAPRLARDPSIGMSAPATKTDDPIPYLCVACDDANCRFVPLRAHRRPLGPRDILIDLRYTGVCHSDVVNAAGHMAGVMPKPEYPYCPGHELAGVCAAVGSEVTRFTIGDFVGVGCIVDSCLECAKCLAGEEQMCAKGMTGTYGARNKFGRAETYPIGEQTKGGYATRHVVDERFAVSIPSTFDLKFAGPVMCAGVTVYDPMRRYGATRGSRVGVVGLGGLGQMAVKIAKALGCEVTVISRARTKEAYAKSIGASNFVCSEERESIDANRGTLDLILNTVPVHHDYKKFQKLLSRERSARVKGRPKQIILGLHVGLVAGLFSSTIRGEASPLAMSGIGGVRATQEVMDLCAKHDIKPDIKVVQPNQLTEVYQILDDGNDGGERFVIDISSMTRAFENGDDSGLVNDVAPNLAPNQSSLNAVGILREIFGLVAGFWLCR